MLLYSPVTARLLSNLSSLSFRTIYFHGMHACSTRGLHAAIVRNFRPASFAVLSRSTRECVMKYINVLLGALLLSISAAVLADPVVIKFSHVVAPDTPKGKA